MPTPEAARHHPHLRALAGDIPLLHRDDQILLLLGRYILRAHTVREKRNEPADAPFAQRRDLGWVIVGGFCVGRTSKQD